MAVIKTVEKQLDEIFVKNAPKLPEGGKKWLVKYLPWITLILGILSLLAAINTWRWANTSVQLIDAANQLAQTYGIDTDLNRLTVWIWISLIILTIQALLYIFAFSPLKNFKKSGWNLVFYVALINIIYAVVLLFSDYGGVGSFIFSMIGSAVGLYLLFQIRSHYKKD